MDSNQAQNFKTSAISWKAPNEAVPKATAISARSVSVSLSSISLMIEKNSSFVTNPVRNGSEINLKDHNTYKKSENFMLALQSELF